MQPSLGDRTDVGSATVRAFNQLSKTAGVLPTYRDLTTQATQQALVAQLQQQLAQHETSTVLAIRAILTPDQLVKALAAKQAWQADKSRFFGGMATDARPVRSIAPVAMLPSRRRGRVRQVGRQRLPFGRGAHLVRTVAVVALLTCAATSHGAEEYREMRAAVSPRLATAELLNAADQQESLIMSVTLQLQHRDELDALIAAQQRLA